jgi:hypothetical protein
VFLIFLVVFSFISSSRPSFSASQSFCVPFSFLSSSSACLAFFSFIHSFFLSLFSIEHYRARRLKQLFCRCPGLNSIGTRSILTNMLWFSSGSPGRCLIGIVNCVAAISCSILSNLPSSTHLTLCFSY